MLMMKEGVRKKVRSGRRVVFGCREVVVSYLRRVDGSLRISKAKPRRWNALVDRG